MRRTALALAAVAAGLLACSSAPVIYAPDDGAGADPTGKVEPLGAHVTPGLPLRVVFLHGVGDHCYGYALGKDGWLNAEAVNALGLHETQPVGASRKIYADVFLGGSRDARKYVEVGTRNFVAALPGVPGETRVEAIEITWSHMTQWVKSNQLGYDSTHPFDAGSDGGCIDGPDATVPKIKEPPPRLLLNRIVKETVFDRNLADAVLYSGSYGKAMELAVAEGLCHAVNPSAADDARCTWPPESDARAYSWIFVTHSLGSRLIYDTILHLIGFGSDFRPNPFTGDQARPFVIAMLANTGAFYMMANQLSLLGLANVPPETRSDNGPRPFVAPNVHCSNVVASIADARLRVATPQSLAATARLQIVAFNDTNDLLTWHVPKWYARKGSSDPDCQPEVDLANVFLQNSAHWLVFESPAAAHENYFRKREVWKIISCGANAGPLQLC
jgi:hypothetical protein